MDTCTLCNNKFHKQCSDRVVENINVHYQRNWLCGNCVNRTSSTSENDSSFLDGISARVLNDRFSEVKSEQSDDDFDLLSENSLDKYYEPEDLNNLLHTSHNGDLFTMCINIRGLNVQKHFAKLEALVQSLPKKPHIIAINETFVKDGEKGFFQNLSGYEFYPNCREKYAQGGVGLYIAHTIDFTPRIELTVMDEKIFESIFVDVHINSSRSVTVGTIYRSPDQIVANNDKFRKHLHTVLTLINIRKNDSFIMGDMNYDLLDTDSADEDLFKDEMYANSFYPVINKPTRITKTTGTSIDNIWTNIIDKPITSGIITDCIADHLPTFQLTEIGEINKKSKTTRCFSERRLQIFRDRALEIDLSAAYYAEQLDDALEVIYKGINQCMPVFDITIQQNTENKQIWYTKDLHKLKIKKERLYRKFMCSKSTSDQSLSNQAKNKYFYELKKTRNKFYKDLFEKHRNNMKATWRAINKLLGKNKTSGCKSLIINNETITDPTIIADSFNTYFTTVATDIRNKLPHPTKNFTEFLPSNSPQFSLFFTPTDPYETKSIINKLKSKMSTGTDNKPTIVLKHLPDNFICALSHVFNRSMAEGVFPKKFKHAKVIPIYKRNGRRSNTENYRPVSLLNNLSKVLEKLIYKRLISFLNKNNFFCDKQFGFQKGLSTANAISLLVNRITKNMNKKQKTLGLFLDLSKAFDLIDFDIILTKLYKCGVRGTAHDWFKSYLTGRTQQVQIGDTMSSIQNIVHGTPQGSILGPLLFLIYINDLPNCLKHSYPIFFADDTTLLLNNLSGNKLIEKGNEDLINIQTWLISNKLALNISKTQAVIFKTPNTQLPQDLDQLKLRTENVQIVTDVKFLGVTIAQNLSWKKHMVNIKTKLRKNLAVCRKIRTQIGQLGALNLYHSMISSHIRYGITSWCHSNTILRKSLEKTSERFLKMVFANNSTDYIQQTMVDHRLLSIDQLLFNEIAVDMYKMHTKMLPECFNELFTTPSHRMTMRSRNQLSGERPRIQLTKQAFNFKGPFIWNKIPNSVKYGNLDDATLLRQFRSFPNFKEKLKDFILNTGPSAIGFYVSQILHPLEY